VQEACVRALRGGFYYGHGPIVIPVYDALLKGPHLKVRKAIASCVSSAAHSKVDVKALVEKLLADSEAEVRKDIAWELKNMKELGAVYRPLVEKAASSDPSDEVKGAALGTLADFMPFPEIVAHYRAILATNPPEAIQRGMVHGFKFRMESDCKAVLKQLMASQHAEVAREAKDGFEFSSN
jgi:hypothetical protein